ncbi:MAG: molybdenum cofactor guanylyltransferase [Desulfuromonas sp.]|nr:molybdenum cofactor guanylyltransferase [Desulfuromonas sp.]
MNNAVPEITLPETPLPGISAAILAGGKSTRMGCDKALLPFGEQRLIDHVYQRLASLFAEVIIVTNSPKSYADIPCRKVVDCHPGMGVLSGIHSALCHATEDRVFIVGCDMPFISAPLIRHICSFADQGEVILPYSAGGHEPLHALYAKSCLPAVERLLNQKQRRVGALFEQVETLRLTAEDIVHLDPQGKSFRNINTPQDYRLIGEGVE